MNPRSREHFASVAMALVAIAGLATAGWMIPTADVDGPLQPQAASLNGSIDHCIGSQCVYADAQTHQNDTVDAVNDAHPADGGNGESNDSGTTGPDNGTEETGNDGNTTTNPGNQTGNATQDPATPGNATDDSSSDSTPDGGNATGEDAIGNSTGGQGPGADDNQTTPDPDAGSETTGDDPTSNQTKDQQGGSSDIADNADSSTSSNSSNAPDNDAIEPDVSSAANADQSATGSTAQATVTQDEDRDNDGIRDDADNCPDTANRQQIDRDNDGLGDACSDDRGNKDANAQVDARGGVRDSSASAASNEEAQATVARDRDRDGVADASDNCPGTPNRDQSDLDNDGKGDACDPVHNAQTDGSGNSVTLAGDACMDCDGSAGAFQEFRQGCTACLPQTVDDMKERSNWMPVLLTFAGFLIGAAGMVAVARRVRETLRN